MDIIQKIRDNFKSHIGKIRHHFIDDIQDYQHTYYTNGILSHNTTTTSSYLIWQLVFHNDKSAFVVANKATTGTEIVAKMKEVLEGLPFFMKPGVINMAANRIKFENGSLLRTAAASKTPATGDSVQLLYVDEAALIAPNIIDDYWASVYPTLSSFRGAQIVMSSTPRGRGNLFYRTYSNAIPWNSPDVEQAAEEKSFISTRVDWWEVPGRIGTNWEAQQRKDLGDELFNQEFGLSFDSAANRLVTQHTLGLMQKLKRNYVTHEFYQVPETISNNIHWHPDFHPNQMSYQELLQSRFLIMVDTAQGKEEGAAGKKDSDYNIINIFKIELMSPHKIEENRNGQPIDITNVVQFKQVGIYYDNNKGEEECAQAAKCIVFNIFKNGYGEIDNTRLLLEMNFNGNNFVNLFKTHPNYYEQVLLQTSRGTEAGEQKLKIGFRTKGGNHGKNYYCEKGSELLHKRQIIISHYDPIPDHSTITQLEQFGKDQKKNTYQGINMHDDMAVTVLFLPIALEQNYFKIWLADWLESLESTPRVDRIRYMLDIYVEQESVMEDEEFSNLMKLGSQNFGKITRQPMSPYQYNVAQKNNSSTGLGGTFSNRINPYIRR